VALYVDHALPGGLISLPERNNLSVVFYKMNKGNYTSNYKKEQEPLWQNKKPPAFIFGAFTASYFVTIYRSDSSVR